MSNRRINSIPSLTILSPATYRWPTQPLGSSPWRPPSSSRRVRGCSRDLEGGIANGRLRVGRWRFRRVPGSDERRPAFVDDFLLTYARAGVGDSGTRQQAPPLSLGDAAEELR